ncbi:MAG: leucine-rich repeat domain-containing protein [Flavobacteriia bacterium]|nr:leucine-rich repeat domain-containing protein [Flavobacteriia bacterium]
MKILKIIVFLSVIINAILIQAQCVECYDLKDALKDAEKVEYLNLSSENLKQFPNELQLFTHLKRLDLSNNQILEFNLPENSLLELIELNLSNNIGFSSYTFSDEFLKNSKIEELNLSKCNMNSLNPNINLLKNLRVLNVSNNKLLTFPSTFSQAKELKEINLSSNKLQRSNCLFTDYWQLEKLDISNNLNLDLNSVVYSLLFKENLKNLTITPNLNSKLLGGVFNLVPINELTIANASIESFDSQLKKNTTITTITFSNCTFTNPDKAFNTIKSLVNLNELNFINTPLPPEISEVDQIKKLNLTDVLVDSECKLQKLDNLKEIEINRTILDSTQIASNNSQTLNKTEIFPLSDEMRTNQVEPVVDLQPVKKDIDSQDSSNITLENSSYQIPQNAFLTTLGTIYNGPVKLEITEMFDPVEMALTGAPMVVNTNKENELMASNGMIKFEAKDLNGNNLKPNPEAIIQVTLKNQQPNNSATLFAFNPQQNNWNTIGTPKTVSRDSLRLALLDSLSKISDSKFIETVFVPVLFTLNTQKRRLDPTELRFSFQSKAYLNAPSSKKIKYFFTPNNDQKWIAKQNWRIDTLMNPDLHNFLDSIRKSDPEFLLGNFNRKTNLRVPRPIQNISIVPDYQNDHFILSFTFKGNEIALPVYIYTDNSSEKTMRVHSRFYEKYLKELKKEEKFRARILMKNKKEIKNLADNERARITALIVMDKLGPQITPGLLYNNDLLTFGLTDFGMINCDYFKRNKPDEYFAVKRTIPNQEGEKIQLPPSARVIFMNTNSYMAASIHKIPYYKKDKTIVFFVLKDNEIAVLKKNKDKIEVFSIAGLSSLEIRKKILGIE